MLLQPHSCSSQEEETRSSQESPPSPVDTVAVTTEPAVQLSAAAARMSQRHATTEQNTRMMTADEWRTRASQGNGIAISQGRENLPREVIMQNSADLLGIARANQITAPHACAKLLVLKESS